MPDERLISAGASTTSSLEESAQRRSRVVRAFFKVRLPAALPQCFVGFKYAAINATVGATIAEFIGSDQGLGFYIQIVTGNMRPDLAFAGIFLLTIWAVRLFPPVLGAVCVYRLWVEPRILPSLEAWCSTEAIQVRSSLPEIMDDWAKGARAPRRP